MYVVHDILTARILAEALEDAAIAALTSRLRRAASPERVLDSRHESGGFFSPEDKVSGLRCAAQAPGKLG